MVIDDFKKLRVYERAFAAAQEVFELSKKWPGHERYALSDQVRRSSRSVCANIAEAWFKRRYPKHWVSKLSDASGEAAETLVWLDFALAANYITPDQATHLEREYRQVCGGLVKMMAHPHHWCPSDNQLQEEPAHYLPIDDTA